MNAANFSTMDATAELFDVFEGHPKAGLLRELQHASDSLKDIHERHGHLLTQAQIAILTGLSRQRIHALIQDGTFTRIDLKATDGDLVGTFVSLSDVSAWLQKNPRPFRRSAWDKAKLVAGALDVSDRAA